MHAGPSHYELLGVPQDATPDELAAARKRLALASHPDRNQDDVRHATLRLQAVNAAYDVLADPDRRRRYDDELATALYGGFEFVCGDVTMTAVGTRLLYVNRTRAGDFPLSSIRRVLIRRHALHHGLATLLIVTTHGRHRFRLPRDAAEAVADVIEGR